MSVDATTRPVTSHRRGTKRRRLIAAAAFVLVGTAASLALLGTSGGNPVPVSDQRVITQSALGGGSSGAEDLLRPAAAADTEPLRIKYLADDGAQGVANGGAIPVGEDHHLEIFVSPYPPTGFAADVDLYLTDTAGRPIAGARVTTTWDMVFMTHGPFDTVFRDLGNGHYVGHFDFFMYGPWELLTTFTLEDGSGVAVPPVSIYVWPEG